jgi:small-conductance mechanosensitive channel
MNFLEEINNLYKEIIEESNGSHGNQKNIDKLLDVVHQINQYLKNANTQNPKIKPSIARVEKINKIINVYPNDGSNQFLSFHEGGDHHPLRRYLRRLFSSEIDLLQKNVDRKYFRQYVQPILTGT